MNGGVDKGHDKQHGNEWVFEKLERFEEQQKWLGAIALSRRSVWQCEAEGCQDDFNNTSIKENVGLVSHGIFLSHTLQNEKQGPRGEDPAHGTAHAHKTELTFGICNMGKCHSVRDGQGGHICQAMNQHQGEKCREIGHPCQGQQAGATNQVADCQKFLSREKAVGKWRAEKHRGKRTDGKGIENPRLLPRFKAKGCVAEVAEDHRQPGTPDKQLKHHQNE